MNVFFSTLNQMGVLFTFIAIGYLLIKRGLLPAGTATILSKLETVVVGVFSEKLTPENISTYAVLMLAGLLLTLGAIPAAIFFASRCSKGDRYIKNIYTYGLVFSNYSYVGTPVIAAMFPEILMEYLIFTVPLGVMIFLWAVPTLLIPDDGEKPTLRGKLKNLMNPIMCGMLIGAVIGYFSIPVPKFIMEAANTLGSCMAPVAMLLTGMTVAVVDVKKVFGNIGIYQVSFLRLIVFPLVVLGILSLLPVSRTVLICCICAAAMPLGLNSVVVPSAYGRDTSVAAGMAMVSHLAACITIPLMLLLTTQIL